MSLIDLLFPKTCVECGRGGIYVCGDCLRKVGMARGRCIECGRNAVGGITHQKCARVLGVEMVWCAYRYEGVIRKAVLRLKYKFAFDLASEMSNVLIERVR